MTSKRLCWMAACMAACVMAAWSAGAAGAPADAPTSAATSHEAISRPDAAAGPTRIYVTIWMADIDSINSAQQNYVANVFVALRWRDPRLAHAGPGVRVYDLNNIWDPRVMVANEIGLVRKTMPDVAEVAADGTTIYRQRYIGAFSQPLQLKEFPLDTHTVRFHLVSPGYTPADLEFVPDDRFPNPGGPRYAPAAGIAWDISLPDWDILACRTLALPYIALPPAQVAGYALEFDAQRHRGYFIWKLILPLTLIILMSWLVFWIDPQNAGTQIGVATTAMLTLIAYRFALDQDVPHVAYLTRLDYFVIGSSMLVFLSLCQVVVTAYLAKADRLALARRIDVWSRLGFLVLLAGLVLVSMVL